MRRETSIHQQQPESD